MAPGYVGCKVNLRRQGFAIGNPRAQCREQYHHILLGSVGSMIRRTWTELEARRQGIELDRRAWQGLIRMHTAADRRGRLTPSRLRTDQLRRQLVALTPVPDAAIRRYYHARRPALTTEELRTFHVLTLPARNLAAAAKRALVAGAPWGRVAERYVGDRQAGAASRVGKREIGEPTLRRAVFHGRVGRLSGPLLGQDGWHLIQLLRIEPAHTPSLRQARPKIVPTLRAAIYEARLRSRYRPQTRCASQYRVPDVPECPLRRP